MGIGIRHFFHKVASGRNKQNMLRGLVDSDGRWVDDNERLLRMTFDYFKDIFSASNDGDTSGILDKVHKCIMDDMNDKFLQ